MRHAVSWRRNRAEAHERSSFLNGDARCYTGALNDTLRYTCAQRYMANDICARKLYALWNFFYVCFCSHLFSSFF